MLQPSEVNHTHHRLWSCHQEKGGPSMQTESRENQTKPAGASESLGAKDYFEQYWRYCAAVRNWLVAFGIGSCVLLVSEKAGIFKDVSQQRRTHIVIWLLVGVICQILLALVNKYIHWCIYWGMEDEKFRKGPCYRIAEKLSRCFWIDVLVDIASVFAFAIAIWMMFRGQL